MRTSAEIDFASSVYSLQEKLGEGGMGVVYRAVHRLSGRQVALKCVHAREATGDTAAAIDATTLGARLGLRLSLVHEFQMLASLHHPNIVTVFDFGFNAQQRPFFTMELLPSPQSILESGLAQSVRAKVALLVQLLQALAYLHRRGIFHRDQSHKRKIWRRNGYSTTPSQGGGRRAYSLGSWIGKLVGSVVIPHSASRSSSSCASLLLMLSGIASSRRVP